MSKSVRALVYSLLFSPLYLWGQYPIEAIPFTQVKFQDRFWADRQRVVREVTIPHTFLKNRETNRDRNFLRAAGLEEGPFCTVYPFDDTDVYKSIEGAAYSLQNRPDPKLEAKVDSLISTIAAAQEPDGYLYTWRSIAEKRQQKGLWSTEDEKKTNMVKVVEPRWNREDQASHELYNAGHLYEAAIAWKQATGKDNLLKVALKNAELVLQDFSESKLKKAPGHQVIEMALVRLYEHTKDQRYLNQAKFFLDARGYGDPYQQNHQKVKDQREAVGHAVRAGYMFISTCDVAAHAHTQEYQEATEAVWSDIVLRKMYVTGGVGASGSNEGFAKPYDLPNYSAYCETCSSISFVMWGRRMFQLSGDSKYVDVMERTLYNALNAGLSQKGDSFFYPNPLESRKNVERVPWFTCACCPPNLTRFFSSLSEYVCGQKGNDVYVNLYAASEANLKLKDKNGKTVPLNLKQVGNFPWEDRLKIMVTPDKVQNFSLKLRIPGWARGEASPGGLYQFVNFQGQMEVKVNGQMQAIKLEQGYLVLSRKWKKGDIVELKFPMTPQLIKADERLEAAKGRLAIQRGPMVYCLEGKDQTDDRILNVLLDEKASFSSQYDPNLFGGISTVSFQGSLLKKMPEAGNGAELQPLALKAIPYFLWANRGKDNMLVWLPSQLQAARPLNRPTLANSSKISASEGQKGPLSAVSDQYLPNNSNDHSNPYIHWWPKFGEKVWLQFDFPQAEQVGTAKVYWFDDEDQQGGCRVPSSWSIQYLEDGQWKNAYSHTGFKVQKDAWNEVQFEPVKTTALRLVFQGKEGVSVGVHEWEVY